MKVLRTPTECFQGLPDYDFTEHFTMVDDHEGSQLRVHYVDEGPRDADPIILMHGEPTWSFLYRHMIARLVADGHRVIAPDLVGFGKSDKPTEQHDYTYARHVSWMAQTLFDHLSIRRATMFGQDWGGLIGLRLVAAEPERFSRVVMSNTGLPTGDRPLSEAFMAWQKYSQSTPTFEVGKIVRGGCAVRPSKEVVAAYDAPFPDDSFKAGARILPSLVPTSVDDPSHRDNVIAWGVLEGFERPFLCCFGDSDPVTKGGDAVFLRRIPGTRGQPHVTIAGGGHFIQEDRGEELSRLINEFILATR
jgi:haloalkane dehalogenase